MAGFGTTLGPNNIKENFERWAACERMSQSGRKKLDLSALLQREKSNDIALNCPTTKPHTVVCRLYGARRRISSSFHATAAALWAWD